MNKWIFRALGLCWLISACMGFISVAQLIPQDRFATHPMGLVLSTQMDELLLYIFVLSIGCAAFWFLNISTMRHASLDVTKSMLRILLPFTICYFPLIVCQCCSKLKQFRLVEYFDAKGYYIWMCSMVVSARLIMVNSLVIFLITSSKLNLQTKVYYAISTINYRKSSDPKKVEINSNDPWGPN